MDYYPDVAAGMGAEFAIVAGHEAYDICGVAVMLRVLSSTIWDTSNCILLDYYVPGQGDYIVVGISLSKLTSTSTTTASPPPATPPASALGPSGSARVAVVDVPSG